MGSLYLEGPGASGGTTPNQVWRSFHGGLRAQTGFTNFAFETRTPSDLGEIKTVMLVDFNFLSGQNTYTSGAPALTQTSSGVKVGAGNNSVARIQWAYGTLGPWLIGQYNSAWADPLLFAPDIGDQNQVARMTTVNIRRPQIRYTYLVGNGISVSGSLESMASGATYCALDGDRHLHRNGTLAAGKDLDRHLRQHGCRRHRQPAELQRSAVPGTSPGAI